MPMLWKFYNNKPILTSKAAEDNATLPFTRNVIEMVTLVRKLLLLEK